MFSTKFNHRPDHERNKKANQFNMPKVRVPLDQLPVSSSIDPDFDGLGTFGSPEVYLAPGLTASFDASFVDARLERSTRHVA